MSVKAMDYVGMHLGRELRNMGERYLLLIIAKRAFDNSGWCKTGQEELALQAGLGLRTVKRYIRALAERGVIVVHKAKGKPGGGRQNAAIELVGFREWRENKVPE